MNVPLKYNIGCGTAKWPDFINVDIEERLSPDLLLDIRNHKLPCEDGATDEIWMFHTLEHITKDKWKTIFREFHRALKQNGALNLAYPEFSVCVENWKNNYRDDREFWESAIYGRQLYPGDFHVSIADSEEISALLRDFGFSNIRYASEPHPNEYNTVLTCNKVYEYITREDAIAKELFAI